MIIVGRMVACIAWVGGVPCYHNSLLELNPSSSEIRAGCIMSRTACWQSRTAPRRYRRGIVHNFPTPHVFPSDVHQNAFRKADDLSPCLM
jgi:hypothetical protein